MQENGGYLANGYPVNAGGPPSVATTMPFIGTVDPETVEDELTEYLQEGFEADTPLSMARVQELLLSSSGPLPWNITEDGSLLHSAVMAEESAPHEVFGIITLLLQAGAPPLAEDADGDTALAATMALVESEDNSGKDPNEDTPQKQVNMAAVRAFVSSPAMPIGRPEVSTICSWLRRHMPKGGDAREQVLQSLVTRVGEQEVQKAWSSEGLLEYLETCAYEKKVGAKADHVSQYLARGASPSIQQSQASALLLVVLNPYCSYVEVDKIFRLMIAAHPGVATLRDAFKLSPFQWAQDHVNIAVQHGLKKTNPASLLALVPAIIDNLPSEIDMADTAIACLKVLPTGSSPGVPQPGAPPVPALRFLEGDRVLCRVQTPGGGQEWEEGVVVGLWYREVGWPKEFPGAPYEVLLDLGHRVFSLADHDHLVRREGGEDASEPAKGQEASQSAKSTASAKGKAKSSRFVRRQREDGKWEMLDTVSGRARLMIDSDSDD